MPCVGLKVQTSRRFDLLDSSLRSQSDVKRFRKLAGVDSIRHGITWNMLLAVPERSTYLEYRSIGGVGRARKQRVILIFHEARCSNDAQTDQPL